MLSGGCRMGRYSDVGSRRRGARRLAEGMSCNVAADVLALQPIGREYDASNAQGPALAAAAQ